MNRTKQLSVLAAVIALATTALAATDLSPWLRALALLPVLIVVGVLSWKSIATRRELGKRKPGSLDRLRDAEKR